ncbi:MAG: hypothetical protein GOP50_04385 [Candidatus Heimdallarchaeota archaeon]|nr:hypothetical protein [Candidatus Heimdallarchaeota archaeon]
MTDKKGIFLLIAYKTSRPTILVMMPFLVISYIVGIIYSSIEPLLYLFPSSGEVYSFQILEGVILVSVTIASSFLIIIAIRKNLVKLLKIIYAFIFFISSVSIFWIHGYLLEVSFSMSSFWLEILLAVIGFIVGGFTVYAIILEKSGIILKNSLIFILGLAMGTVFGSVFPIASFLSLLICISLFDIYSVFKGPINQLLKKTNMSLSTDKTLAMKTSIAIGIGDFVFYSSLVTFVTKDLGPILGFTTIVGILVGIKMTENMLIRYGRFPGLPIPVFLSLLLVLFGWVVSKYIVFF